MAYISTNRTIGECIKYGYKITAYCNGCHHNVALDLSYLAEKLGSDHGAMHKDLVPKLRCFECRGKNIGLILTHRSADREGIAKFPKY
ncbi:hypothetical protein LQT97_09675 [Brucella pseudogrignonensis]|uniref:hypothetical protein n=1 Tax=Brucella pseudogrignonensis TaxID=419475 RepID=UPI001E2C4269|nr:hypothetical protein [Brucella pseudogrignonensis]MCD4511506.1 hypothetical protein [Brucella pseudogrignonensis]